MYFFIFFDITYFSGLGLSADSWSSHSVSAGRATEKASQTGRSSENLESQKPTAISLAFVREAR